MKTDQHLSIIAGEEAIEVAEASLLLSNEIPRAAGAVAKSTAKAARFGFHEINPVLGKTPIQSLVDEFNDMVAAFELLQEAGVPLPGLNDRVYIECKKEKVKRMMKISISRGLLEKPEEL